MGCVKTKVDCEQNVKNQDIMLKQSAGPPLLDPRLPLTPKQHFLLQKSWKAIKRNIEGMGIELFMK